MPGRARRCEGARARARARHARRGDGVRQVPGRARRGEGARQAQGHARQRGECTRGHPRSCSAAWHLLLLRRRELLVAVEPTQPIFDDEPPEDITQRHTPGHTARHCARVTGFFWLRNPATKKSLVAGLLPTRTGRGHTGNALDSPGMPCRRRADLTALGRRPKSWSWTIKGISSPPVLRATPPPFCSQICSDSGTPLLKWKI